MLHKKDIEAANVQQDWVSILESDLKDYLKFIIESSSHKFQTFTYSIKQLIKLVSKIFSILLAIL